MPVFFINSSQIDKNRITITGSLADHLRQSLRVRMGEHIVLGTENRKRLVVKIDSIAPRTLGGLILEEQALPERTHPKVDLGMALLKGEKMSWVIQKSSELGISSFFPIISGHSIPRPRPERVGNQQDRWQRIAYEAAQQSEQTEVMRVTTPQRLTPFLQTREPGSLHVMLLERQDAPGLQSLSYPTRADSTITLLIGPEGGWTTEEIEQCRQHGCVTASLGLKILRAETAALVAISLVQNQLGQLG